MVTDELKAYFSEHNIKQVDIAEKLGVQKSFVSELLAGKRTLGHETAVKLSKAYGFDINWLLTGEGSMLKTRLYESDEQEKVLTSEWYKGLLDEYNNVKEENKQLREENETLKNKEAELLGMLKNALAVKAAEIKK